MAGLMIGGGAKPQALVTGPVTRALSERLVLGFLLRLVQLSRQLAVSRR
jgi:hypothetical protein